jgi:hypothetical protein
MQKMMKGFGKGKGGPLGGLGALFGGGGPKLSPADMAAMAPGGDLAGLGALGAGPDAYAGGPPAGGGLGGVARGSSKARSKSKGGKKGKGGGRVTPKAR